MLTPTLFGPSFHLYRMSLIVYPTEKIERPPAVGTYLRGSPQTRFSSEGASTYLAPPSKPQQVRSLFFFFPSSFLSLLATYMLFLFKQVSILASISSLRILSYSFFSLSLFHSFLLSVLSICLLCSFFASFFFFFFLSRENQFNGGVIIIIIIPHSGGRSKRSNTSGKGVACKQVLFNLAVSLFCRDVRVL